MKKAIIEIEVGLIRHAEKRMNQLDPTITETGIQSTYELAESLRNQKWDLVISSDLERARATARIISEVLGIPVSYCAKLREREHGVLTNMSKTEKDSLGVDFLTNVEGRESLRSFLHRVEEVNAYLTQHFANQRILLISHGGFLKTFFAACVKGDKSRWTYLEMVRISWNGEAWHEII